MLIYKVLLKIQAQNAIITFMDFYKNQKVMMYYLLLINPSVHLLTQKPT